jgi:hypothetical protein
MPKLFLRDLFAVVTLAAVLLAWWLDHRRLTKENADLKEHNRTQSEIIQILRPGFTGIGS